MWTSHHETTSTVNLNRKFEIQKFVKNVLTFLSATQKAFKAVGKQRTPLHSRDEKILQLARLKICAFIVSKFSREWSFHQLTSLETEKQVSLALFFGWGVWKTSQHEKCIKSESCVYVNQLALSDQLSGNRSRKKQLYGCEYENQLLPVHLRLNAGVVGYFRFSERKKRKTIGDDWQIFEW